MEKTKIDKNNTHLASEYFVAAELYRRGYGVGMTLGNAKAVDLFVAKGDKHLSVQVKGMHSQKRSICWSISLNHIIDNVIYVLVDLNSIDMAAPDYFIFVGKDLRKVVKPVASGRDYIDRSAIEKTPSKGAWHIIEKRLQ